MQLQPLTSIAPIDDWDIFCREGKQFLDTAIGAYTKKKKTFSSEVIYNLVAMSIEKYIMAFLMRHGDLADNHTMRDLMNSLERHVGAQPELREKLEYLDKFQDICDAEAYVIIKPSDEDVKKMIAIGTEIQSLLSPFLQDNTK